MYEMAIKINQSLFWCVKQHWQKHDLNDIDILDDIWDIIVSYWYVEDKNNSLVNDYANLLNEHFNQNHNKKAIQLESMQYYEDKDRVFLVHGRDKGKSAWYYVLVD